MLGFLKHWFAKPGRNANPILLVIAESKVTQETIRQEFESLNCKVIPALSGKSAWQSLEVGPLPDLVILDFVFSDEDGPRFYRRLMTDKRFSSIPVLPLPSSLSDELVTKGVKTLGDLPTSPIVITTTPYALLFSVAHILREQNSGLPILFLEKLRNLNR